MKPFLLKSNITKFVPVIFGFVIVILGGILYSRTHRPIPAQILYEAKMFAVDPGQYNELHLLDVNIFKQSLTEDEWECYKSYATGSNLVFKRQAARHLSAARGRRYEQEALAITKTLAADPDPTTRAYSLLSMSRLSDANWKETAHLLLTDPNPAPRNMAIKLLDRDSKKKAASGEHQ